MIIKKLILAIMVVFLTAGISHAVTYDDIEDARYIKNYDGDTITFNLPFYPDVIGDAISVRVLGIDAPEIKGSCDQESKDALYMKSIVHNEILNAKKIKIVNVQRDKYFRILGDVIYDGKSLKDFLLTFSIIHPYDGGTKTNHWCENK